MPIYRARRPGRLLRRVRSLVVPLLTCLLALSAGCGSAAPAEPTAIAAAPPSPRVVAGDTLVPASTPTASPPPSATPSPTNPPASTVTATATMATATPTPAPTGTSTATSSPSPTEAPTATSTPTLPVYDAAYVADVTVPDGTAIEPGTPFTKTWRLRNTGNAPWEEGTALMLAAGEAMGAPEAVLVPATLPGETADVSVSMVAPTAIGEHSAAWRLCRAGGCFGGAVTLRIASRSTLAARGPAVELPPPAEAVECNYIGNRNPTSMKFHRADCRWVKEMYEGNKVCFATREEAIAAGYVPCKVCKP